MNEQDKHLLLADICARLQYGVKFKVDSHPEIIYTLRKMFIGSLEPLVDGYFNDMPMVPKSLQNSTIMVLSGDCGRNMSRYGKVARL